MEYRVELGRKIWKKCRKAHILGKSRAHVPVQVRGVPLHPVLFSQFRPVFVFWK